MAVGSEQLAVSSEDEVSLKEQLDFCEENLKFQKGIATHFPLAEELKKLAVIKAIRDTIRVEYLLEQEANKYKIKEGVITKNDRTK